MNSLCSAQQWSLLCGLTALTHSAGHQSETEWKERIFVIFAISNAATGGTPALQMMMVENHISQ